MPQATVAHDTDPSVASGSPPPRPSGAPIAAGRGPLAGCRVLDLGTILAGPYAGALLAELGADVVKVESPAGDAFRETGFVYNRGMRSLSIDLSTPAGQQAFHRLARSYDVVIDNFRLGVLKRLRADYATLCDHNPSIVSLSIAGFGEHGPLAPKPAFDPVLQAMSGMMAAQGAGSDPVFFTIPINDVAAAVTSVLAVCLGLFHRARTGEGQRAVTSLVASSLAMQSGELVRFEGRPPAVRGGRDFLGPSAADRFCRVADGWLRIQAPNVAALEEALSIERRPPVRLVPGDRPGRGGLRPLDGATDPSSAVAQAVASMPLATAVERLTACGIPAAPARHPAELTRDPEIRAAGLLAEHRFPDGTAYFLPHRYALFSRTEQRSVLGSPGVGEHSRPVLAEAGLNEAEIDTLLEHAVVVQGSPLRLQGLVNYR